MAASVDELQQLRDSPREWSQRSEFTMFNTLVLAPNVVSGEVDVFPAER